MLFRRLQKAKDWVKRCVSQFAYALTTAVALSVLSCVIYILFFKMTIPEISAKGPLHFVFSDCKIMRCNHPAAIVDFNDIPFKFKFQRGEQYEFVVELVAPETASNHDVGMFVISIQFISDTNSKKNHVFKKEKKSTMMRYRSPLISTISSIIYSPFLVYGFSEETQKITKVISNYEEKPEFALNKIKVAIESYKLDFYEAHLRVQIKLEGFRYFMYNYTLTSFFIGSALFFVPVTVIFLAITSNSFEKRRKTWAAVINVISAPEVFDKEAKKDSKIVDVKQTTNQVKQFSNEVSFTKKVEPPKLRNERDFEPASGGTESVISDGCGGAGGSKCEDVRGDNSEGRRVPSPSLTTLSSLSGGVGVGRGRDQEQVLLCTHEGESRLLGGDTNDNGDDEDDEGSIEVLASGTDEADSYSPQNTSYDMCEGSPTRSSSSETEALHISLGDERIQ